MESESANLYFALTQSQILHHRTVRKDLLVYVEHLKRYIVKCGYYWEDQDQEDMQPLIFTQLFFQFFFF